jgi:hypothetical protein
MPAGEFWPAQNSAALDALKQFETTPAEHQVIHRLELFQKTAKNASEIESLVCLDPREVWEFGDQVALDALELEIRLQQGETPLFENLAQIA